MDRTYKAFFEGKTWTYKAASLFHAKELAIEHFKPSKAKRGLIAVVLADVPIDPASL